MIRLHCIRPQIDGKFRLDPQKVTPLQRPVTGKLVPPQKLVNQRRTLAGTAVLQKVANILRFGQRADCIQIYTPDKNRIGTEVCRFDSVAAECFLNQRVDTIVRYKFTAIFKLHEACITRTMLGANRSTNSKYLE